MMQDFGLVIEAPLQSVAIQETEFRKYRPVRSQPVRYHRFKNEAMPLQQFAHGELVASGLNKHLENFSFGICSSPEMNPPTTD